MLSLFGADEENARPWNGSLAVGLWIAAFVACSRLVRCCAVLVAIRFDTLAVMRSDEAVKAAVLNETIRPPPTIAEAADPLACRVFAVLVVTAVATRPAERDMIETPADLPQRAACENMILLQRWRNAVVERRVAWQQM